MIALQIYSHAINEVDGMTGKKDVPHFESEAHLPYECFRMKDTTVETKNFSSLQHYK